MCKLFCFVDHPTTYSVFAIVFSISLFDYWGRSPGTGVLHINNNGFCGFGQPAAVIVGANPGKFTRPKPKRKPKAAPHTRPGIVKSQRKAKRNMEPPDYPGNSLSLPCLFTHVSPTRYFDRRARETGCGFLSYRKFGVVFKPPQDSANCMHIRSFSGAFGMTMYATFPEQSNKW